MKAIFFSDIHGITTNLDKIERVIESLNPNYIVVLGDLYGADINNNQIIYDFLMKYKDNLIVTLGNCDKFNDLFVENTLINLDNNPVFISHGHEYNYDKESKIENSKILVYGHKHIPYIRKRNDINYICVGSISLPRNELGPTYMVYEDSVFKIFDIDSNIIDELSV